MRDFGFDSRVRYCYSERAFILRGLCFGGRLIVKRVKFDEEMVQRLAQREARQVMTHSNARQDVLRDELDAMLDSVVEYRTIIRELLWATTRVKDLAEAAADGGLDSDEALDAIFLAVADFPYTAGGPYEADDEEEGPEDANDDDDDDLD